MDMSFGKFKGKPVARVLLTKPDYFKWMDSNGLQNKSEFKFMQKLLKILNDKPFNSVRCSGTCKGANVPTRLSLYKGRFNNEIWFCDSCDPYSKGAFPGDLNTIRSYEGFISIGQTDFLIKIYCKAKGVPKRKTKQALKIYFDY